MNVDTLLETAIARRNIAWYAFVESDALLAVMKAMGGVDLTTFISSRNHALYEYEWSLFELSRAQARWGSDRMWAAA